MGTIIIGIGNPVLTDDSVGLKIADGLRDRLRGQPGVVVTQLCCGGINLMEAMFVERFDANSYLTLSVAMELGEAVGLRLPADVRIWAVEANDVWTFSEDLTAEVQRAVPLVVEDVVRSLEPSPHRLSGRTTI